MSSFKTRKADELSHWFVLIDSWQHSSAEFYAEIERELAAREVPDLTVTKVDFAEGGLLSDKRTYLRMIRERLVFDVCAAPFGKAYFFSLRFAEIPALVSLPQLLGAVAVSLFSLFLLVDLFGLILAPVVFVLGILALAWIARNAIGLGLKNLDASLIGVPVIGPLYERFVRKESYYRKDTRLMYHTMVSELVKKKVEEVTASKGIKYLETYEQSSILGELYKQKQVALKASAS